jgi:hypothetical protein
VTYFVMLVAQPKPPVEPSTPQDQRTFWLESWDGTVRIPIGSATHDGPVQLLTDASGLEEAPTSVTIDGVPGVAGGVATFSQTLVREPLLPLRISTANQAEQWVERQRLADLTDPSPEKLTPDGSFRLVCATPAGTRQVGLVRQSGMDGTGTELPWTVLYVLDCAAPQPFAEDREETPREYSLGSGGGRFIAWDTGDVDTPAFQDARLAWDVILGDDMPLVIESEVAPYVTAEIDGPADAGTLIEADTGLYLPIIEDVVVGSTLRIVTSPRGKSIRLITGSTSVPAAQMVGFDAVFKPLAFGTNNLSVTAPGATSATRLRLLYRGQYRSMF